MSKLFDRAGHSTATAGTGTITLGAALGAVALNVCSFQSFATAGVANADVVSYLILDSNGAWEYGTGTYTSVGTTLSRTLGASSTGSLLNLSGNAQVFITARAEDLLSISLSQTANQVFAAPNGSSGTPGFRALVPADLGITKLTNSLGANVALSNTAAFFDGPSVAQGTSGTWFASGTVTLQDTNATSQFIVILWDGTTIIASGAYDQFGASNLGTVSVSGVITNPAGNLRISVKGQNATTGLIVATAGGGSGNTSSTITAFRIG